MITVKRKVAEEMVTWCRKELPNEGCGYLAEKDGIVSRCLALTNTDYSAEHFAMDPQEQFAAYRQCRNDGFVIRAVFHSHPETPARPSEEDLRLAVDPDVSYVIVSFAGLDVDTKSFVIQKGVSESEQIEIVD